MDVMGPKAKALMLGLLVASCLLAVIPPEVKAEAQVTTLPLTFHNYSVVLDEPNGSVIGFDGANGAPPAKSTADTANIKANISGSFYGFSTYTGMALWAVQLPCDLHVKGAVAIKAYISSTSNPGFGAGYGMGVVDIDENNKNVNEFYTEGPQSMFSSPFTGTPTAFSLSTNVDYTFKKGHAIGFFVGVGSTAQGFTATVYFDSADRPSGATLPIIEPSDTQTISVGANVISVSANSAISSLKYDQTARTTIFKALLIDSTDGTVTIEIPKTVLTTPFTVTQGSKTITPTVTETSNAYQVAFTHTRNDDTIKVVGSAITTATDSPTPTPTSTAATATPSGSPSSDPSSPSETSGSSSGNGGSSSTSSAHSVSPSPEAPEMQAMIILGVIIFVTASIFLWSRRISNRKLWQTF
jgi:hypothetical protein